MKRLLPGLLWLALALATASPALASDPAERSWVPAISASAPPDRRPVLCTPLGCRRAPSAAWSWVAGFGAAAWAARRLGSRRR